MKMKTNLTPLAYFSCLSFNRNHLFLQFCKREFKFRCNLFLHAKSKTRGYFEMKLTLPLLCTNKHF